MSSTLKNSLAVIAATTPADFKSRMQAVPLINARITALETEMGMKLSLPVLNPEKAAAKLQKLEAQRAAFTPTPIAAAPPVAAPVVVERVFVSSGDPTIDAAVKAGGSKSLEEHRLRVRQAELNAALARYPAGTADHECATKHLADVNAELARLK